MGEAEVGSAVGVVVVGEGVASSGTTKPIMHERALEREPGCVCVCVCVTIGSVYKDLMCETATLELFAWTVAWSIILHVPEPRFSLPMLVPEIVKNSKVLHWCCKSEIHESTSRWIIGE